MRIRIKYLALMLAAAASACAAKTSTESDVAVSKSQLGLEEGPIGANIEVEAQAVHCASGQPKLGLVGFADASEATTMVTMTKIDGGAEQESPMVGPGDFIADPDGFFRAWVASDVSVPSGAHTVDICFAIKIDGVVGSNRACLDSINTDFNVDCSDSTPPSITCTAAPGANAAGWNNTDVHVTCVCDDAESGVSFCSSDNVLNLEGVNPIGVIAINGAGLFTQAEVGPYSIDMTAPSASSSRSVAPNAAGWNNEPVTVSCACDDALSGVASCSAAQTFGSDGAGQSYSCTAVDVASNSTSVVESLNIDMTAPTVSYVGALTYNTTDTVNIQCVAADALSGLASSTCANVTGLGSSFGVGSHTVSATATDKAGNTASASVTFTVNSAVPPPTVVTVASICAAAKQYSSSKAFATVACANVEAIGKAIAKNHISEAKLLALVFTLWVNLCGAFSHQEATTLVNMVWKLFP